MKIRATPTDDPTRGRIEIYERTNSDGQSERIFYDPDESQTWLKATASSTVELEDWR